jgi:hypothetical protein
MVRQRALPHVPSYWIHSQIIIFEFLKTSLQKHLNDFYTADFSNFEVLALLLLLTYGTNELTMKDITKYYKAGFPQIRIAVRLKYMTGMVIELNLTLNYE